MSQPISIGNYWEKNFFEGHVGIFHFHRAWCQKAAGKKQNRTKLCRPIQPGERRGLRKIGLSGA